jgi:hypothetical protein
MKPANDKIILEGEAPIDDVVIESQQGDNQIHVGR